jgi:hypothetical protein
VTGRGAVSDDHRFGSATAAWDSNSPDPRQAVEIVAVATDHGYPPDAARREPTEIERSKPLQ